MLRIAGVFVIPTKYSLNETIFRAHADLLVLCGKPVDAIYQELKKIIHFLY